MPKFGEQSKSRLREAHPDMQRLLEHVVREFDCTIIYTYRNEELQRRLYGQGRDEEGLIIDKKKVVTYCNWPDSKHNSLPSPAVDVVPWPTMWSDRELLTLFGGYVLGTASVLEIPIRWGGDWNKNFEVSDENFRDLGHFELIE